MNLYRITTTLLEPILVWYLRIRRYQKKESQDQIRFEERFGNVSIERPQSTLLYIHGASIGKLNIFVSLTQSQVKL